MPAPSEFQAKLESIEKSIQRIDLGTDPHLRKTAQELVQLVMELHGSGIERILEILYLSGPAGQEAMERLSHDDLVSSLLVLHGLHPLSVEDRLMAALDKIRPSLKKRGAEIELLQCVDGVVILKLKATSHAASLKEVVEGAVYQAAPDIRSLDIEMPDERQGFVPLDMLRGTLAASGKGGL